MKKILILFILFTGAYQLKAQQLFQAKPADSLSKNLLDKYLKTKPNDEWQLLKPQLNLNETLSALNTKKFTLNDETFYSRMPVAVLEGYSKMPVVNLGGYSKMPVKRIELCKPTNTGQKSFPGIPAFRNPVQ
jgi:hypothetical protein